MINVTFITGNDEKIAFLKKYLELDLPHKKLELEEIQSLNLKEITEYKARQAYAQLDSPVLVEDVSFTLRAMGNLPGPLIKWFLQEIGPEGVCQLADFYGDRRARAEICYAYFDGRRLELFDGALDGSVAEKPRTDDNFGWNRIFIRDGQTKTNSEMNEEETRKYSLRTSTIYPRLKKFLLSLDNKKA